MNDAERIEEQRINTLRDFMEDRLKLKKEIAKLKKGIIFRNIIIIALSLTVLTSCLIIVFN